MRAVITVIGKDRVGIIAGISKELADANVNILDISQTTMQDIFTMIMLVDLGGANKEFHPIAEAVEALSKPLCLDIRMMHEDVFNSMHNV